MTAKGVQGAPDQAMPFRQREQLSGRALTVICIAWSLFQLWIAADFPFYLSELTGLKLVLNGQEARQIHLAFGLGLGLLAYPAIHKLHPAVDRPVSYTHLTLPTKRIV